MVKTKNIDGIEFTVAPFPAIEALRLKSYLLKTLGPAMAEAIDLFRAAGGDIDSNLSGDSLCGVVEKLTSSLDEDSFVALIKRMFQFVSCKGTDEGGKPLVAQFGGASFEDGFNRVFPGRLFSIYPVMLLVLEANYPDFFGKMAANFGGLTARISTFAQGSENGKAASNKSKQ